MAIQDDFIRLEGNVYECIYCKEIVPSGVLNIMNHYDTCEKDKERVSFFSHLSDEEFWKLYEMKARQIFGATIRNEEAMYRSCFPKQKSN